MARQPRRQAPDAFSLLEIEPESPAQVWHAWGKRWVKRPAKVAFTRRSAPIFAQCSTLCAVVSEGAGEGTHRTLAR